MPDDRRSADGFFQGDVVVGREFIAELMSFGVLSANG
jgi:hypothetical protein